MAQRGKEKSSEASISSRRKWNFTVKPRFDLGVFGEGAAADRDIRDFAEVFIWKQAAIENDFPQRIADARVIWRRRASRFWPRMTASLIRVAAPQLASCCLLNHANGLFLFILADLHSRALNGGGSQSGESLKAAVISVR